MRAVARRAVALVALALAGAAPAGAVVPEVAPLAAGRGDAAYCLRATGAPGALSVAGSQAGGRSFGTDEVGVGLLEAAAAGLARTTRPALPSVGCAAVATAPGGAAVAAGPRYDGGRYPVRAAVRDPGGRLGRPVALGSGGTRQAPVAAAVAPDGSALVAWIEARASRARVVAARRPAGAAFGPAEPVTGWARAEHGGDGLVAAGVDAAGSAVLAWALPSRRRDGLVAIPAESDVAVARAAPGARFGPAQRLARRLAGVTRLALAVAPDRRALLAFDGGEHVRAFESAAGEPFAGGPVAGGGDTPAVFPAVALRDGGGAVLAWSDEKTVLWPRDRRAPEGGIRVMTREAPGAFGPPQALPTAPGRGEAAFPPSLGAFVPAGLASGPQNLGPHVALAPDGRLVVAWIDAREAPDGDVVAAARAAAGTLAGGLGPAEWLGGRCRSAGSVAALPAGDGEPAVAFTDNRSSAAFGRGLLELPTGGGRVHLAFPHRAGAANPAAPRVTLRARPQALLTDEPVELRARCDVPCVLRGVTVPGDGLGTAAVRRAGGTTTLRVRQSSDSVAEPRTKRLRVAVHACSLAGDAVGRARIAIPVRRRRAPAVARVLGLQAVRRGHAAEPRDPEQDRRERSVRVR